MLLLRVQIEAEAVDVIESLLFSCGAVSVAYTDGACNPILEPKPGEHPLWSQAYVHALFSDEIAISLATKALENESQVSTQIILEQIDEHGWQEKFQQQFNAMQYSSNLWVYPSWQDNPNPQGISIQLDPGLAFGTGQHPTTHLCMQWLAEATLPNKTVIDYGCGSGILALAACKLGALHVYAVDIDPQAIIASKDNCERNAVDNGSVSIGDTAMLKDLSADIIIANILAGPLLDLRDTFLRHLSSAGTLVLSGILTTQTPDIIKHYLPQFECSGQTTLEDWACITFDRKYL